MGLISTENPMHLMMETVSDRLTTASCIRVFNQRHIMEYDACRLEGHSCGLAYSKIIATCDCMLLPAEC